MRTKHSKVIHYPQRLLMQEITSHATILQTTVLGAHVLPSPALPSPPLPSLVLLVPRNDAVTRSGKASKALEKSRKQVEEGNKEATQLKVLVFSSFFFSFDFPSPLTCICVFVPCRRRSQTPSSIPRKIPGKRSTH